jgi:hypothetical protein
MYFIELGINQFLQLQNYGKTPVSQLHFGSQIVIPSV